MRREWGTAAMASWWPRRSETPRGRRPRSPRPSQKHKQTRTHVVVTLKSLRRDRVRTHALSGQVRVANDRRERGLQFHHQSVAAKNENWWFDTARARARRVMLKHPGGGTGPGTSRSLRRWKVRKSEGEKEERDSDKSPPMPPHNCDNPPPPPGTNTVISTETDWALLTSKFEERNEFYLVRGNIAMRRDGKTVPTFAGYGLHCSPLTHAVLLICNTATYFLIQNLSQKNWCWGYTSITTKNYRIRSL